ncbi:MAG TPA: ATP-binding protein, partial [Roseiflexaceae bacterium]|nr:ATP-binding protein [Roseiflexaceae bacterium]
MNSTSSSAPARGERPPQPDLAVYLLRGGFLICLGLVVGQPWLQQLPATDLLLAITQPTAGIWSLVGLGVQTLVQHPAVVAAAWVGATAGMLLLLGELFLALLVLPIHQLRQRWLRFSYLRISLPPAGERPAMSVPPAPDRLFRALHAALGNRWVTLLLWCDGDRSVEYGLRVPQAVAGRWMPRLRAAIRSILPDARIEPLADPLEQVLQSGRILALRDYTLALPPHYPLRPALSAADAEISGLLAALRPPVGVVHVELQVALRPISSAHWRLDRGWRGRAMALRLQLQRHADYTLPSDLAAIDARLASTPFDVVVCAVVVAEVVDAAHETLAALDAALAGSTWRTAGRVQQFIPHTTRMQPTHAGRYHSAVHTIRPPLVPRLLLPANLWRTADILSSAELAALIGIPGAALDRLVDRMSNRILPAPPHAFAAAADRIILGDAVRDDGSHAPVGPTLDDLRQILHLTAGMGAGKSRLLANLCRQFIATGFTLIDGKGDDRDGSLVATVRALLPPADERRLILFDP